MIDPFSSEIIRHKLFRIIDEGVSTLESVSGSHTTVEAHDLSVSLHLPNGDLLMGVLGFLQALPPAAQASKHIIDEFKDEVFEDDIFMLNDSRWCMHTSDANIIAPVFYKGVLAGWTANFIHLRDIGAINPGGHAPDASEVYHEGFDTPGIKLVEKGVVRKDVWRTLLNMVRVPELVALDLRSQIAATNTTKKRMVELYDKYGVEAVEEVSRTLLSQSERLAKNRLREYVDGVWEARHHLDVKDKLYEFVVKMSKKSDSVIFDFSGSSKQAPIGVNCSYWSTVGSVFASLAPQIFYDIPWNEGLLAPVRVIAPEGTVTNCSRPASACTATVNGMFVVSNTASETISQMQLATPKFQKEATAIWRGASQSIVVWGKRNGRFVVGQVSDGLGGSGGARVFDDGVDYGGEIRNPYSRVPNVEYIESSLPVLYLFRRLKKDSGGPGKFRGGTHAEIAIVSQGSDGGNINLGVGGKGTDFPHGVGIAGGYPGSNAEFSIFRGTRIKEIIQNHSLPKSLNELNHERKQSASWGTFELSDNDIFYVSYTGAGGYGDPLERDPERVKQDVVNGLVSLEAARLVYGVVLLPDASINVEATTRTRSTMRSNRRSQVK